MFFKTKNYECKKSKRIKEFIIKKLILHFQCLLKRHLQTILKEKRNCCVLKFLSQENYYNIYLPITRLQKMMTLKQTSFKDNNYEDDKISSS